MTLTEEARELIRAHLNSSSLSMAALARSSGVPATTARSIIQGEVSKASLENITALLRSFMSAREVLAVVEKHESEGFHSDMSAIYAQKDAVFLQSSQHSWITPDHEIAALASNHGGISRSAIKRIYGEKGIVRLEALLESEVLREINGRVKQAGEFVEYSQSDSIRKARLQTESFKESDFVQGAFLYHLTLNCSHEGLDKARELARSFLFELNQLEGKYPGTDSVMMLSLAANVLSSEEETK